MKAFHHHLLIAMAMLLGGSLAAQHSGTNFILDQPIPGGQHSYTATEFVRLAPGFRYQPLTGTDSFYASINELLLFPPEEGLTGGHPDNDRGGMPGTLPGDLMVSATGGAVYNIPVSLPDGVAGMTPQLALSYNSQGGNGLLGLGWSLNGLSAISRTGKTIYNDGQVEGIRFNPTDNYALDGQRLLLVNSSAGVYSTEVESFSKIEAVGYVNNGPQYFKVYTKSGQILYYGSEANSKIEATGRSEALNWLLDKIEDRMGNVIQFTYEETGGMGIIKKIQYGANQKTNQGHIYEVVFDYVDGRPYQVKQYLMGSFIETRYLLDKIHINRINGQSLYHYQLEYKMDFYPRLEHIWLYEGSGTTNYYNPTVMEWGSFVENGFISIEHDDGFQFDYLTDNFFLDVNGDGLSDKVAVKYDWYQYDGKCGKTPISWNYRLRNQNNSFSSPVSIGALPANFFSHLIAADFNGDGLDDFAYVRFNHENQDYTIVDRVGISNGNGFDVYVLPSGGIQSQNHPDFQVGDFDGNGKADLMLVKRESAENNNNVFVYSFNDVTHSFTTVFSYYIGFGNTDYDKAQVIIGDFDGDGRSDLMRTAEFGGGQHTSNCFIYRINLQSGVAEYLYGTPSNGYPSTWHQIYTGDFNGDGITDILTYNYTAANPVWEIALFTGTGFVNMPGVPNIGHFDLYESMDAYLNKLLLADFNNDAKTDILVISKENSSTTTANFSLFYSNGREFANTMEGSFVHQGGFSALQCYKQFRRESVSLVMDFNGDAYADFYISKGIYKDWVFLHDPSNTFNRVLSFTNGLGTKSSPEYLPLTNPEVYSKDHTATYPLRDIQPAMYVVSAVRRANIQTEKPLITEKYFYNGAKVHMQGKGFLGFAKRTVHNLIQNISTEEVNAIYKPNNYYYYPYNASTITKYNNRPNAFTLSESYNLIAHKTNSTNQKVFFPYIERSNAWTYEYSSQSHQLSTRRIAQYDNFGNLTQLTELSDSLLKTIMDPNSAFNHEKITETTYLNDNVNWLFRPDFVQTKVRYHSQPDIIHKTVYDYYPIGHPSFPLIRTLNDCPNGDQTNPLLLATSYEYDAYGNVIKQILSAPVGPSPSSRTTEIAYAPEFKHRLPTSETNAMGYVNTFEYDDQYGRLLTEADPNGLTTTHTSHPLGIESWVKMPDETMSCKAIRWVNNHPDAPENATFYEWTKTSGQAEQLVFYHKTGAELRSVSTGFDGTLIYTDTEYDDKNRVVRVSTPYFKTGPTNEFTEYEYDDIGRKQSVRTPDGTTTSYEYDNISQRTTVSDGSISQSSRQYFNAAGWLSKSVDDAGNEVKYHYFSDGKLHQTMVASQPGTLVTIAYNDRRQRTLLDDPNYGQKSATYNAFGEVLSQTNPKGQTETYVYDLLGRMIQRTDVIGVTTWVYNNSDNKKGTLASVGMSGHTTSFEYDTQLRLTQETENIQGQPYTTQYNYDALGRPLVVTHPSGFATKQVYNELGYLVRIIDNQNAQLLYELKEMNALGQLTQSYAGNGYTTYKSYHPLTYRLNTVVTSRPDKPVLQDMEYNWTSFGNLESRKKWLSRPGGISLTESFGYDNLNRLDWIMLNGVETGKHTYDEKGLGNITYKKADGTVLFGEAVYGGNNAGPHALSSATSAPGVFPAEEQSMRYNAFDKVTSITQGDKFLQITYGHHRQRIGQQYTAAGSTTTKVYVGACEYITKRGETTIHTYLSGPEGLFAVVVKESKGLYNIQYIHTDHLGSWNTISDAAGNRLQEINFDAWGNRRDPNTWRAFASTPPEPLFDRGFTGHEHLYGFQLINMNGRMYDPVVSRMLSPDNFVQAPDFSQSFNRYSYAWNNPLVLTDPSGEFIVSAIIIGAFINATIQVASGNVNNMGDFFTAIGIGALSGAAGGIAGQAVAGSISFGGFTGGGLIGAASGASSGFIAGAGNAWATGANFSDGLNSGLIGGSIGALTGGLVGGFARGISDFKNEYSFWDGSKVSEFVIGSSQYENIANGYNSSGQADINDEILQMRMQDDFGIKQGDFNIQKITTRTSKGYGMTTYGDYINLESEELVGGYVRHFSTGHSDFHVSPFFSTGDDIAFRAIAGHELIHAYHNFALPNVSRVLTERVAYKYTYDVFMNNGHFNSAFSIMNKAMYNSSGSFWGSFPDQYQIPSPYRFY